MISSILQVLGGLFTSIGTWMNNYANSKNTAARAANDDTHKLDEFKKAEANGNIQKVRSDLSVPPPD